VAPTEAWEDGFEVRRGVRWWRKFAPAISSTRTGDAAISTDEGVAKFASVHASFHNHFNQERHLVDRQTYKIRRSAALAEWQSLAA
jgi:hypothetical protein